MVKCFPPWPMLEEPPFGISSVHEELIKDDCPGSLHLQSLSEVVETSLLSSDTILPEAMDAHFDFILNQHW